MVKLIKWPDIEILCRTVPKHLRNDRSCVSIIDWTEIFIKRALNLQAHAQTWSTYKNNNTIKYFISITPVGTILFLLHGWGGQVSDKELTNTCGFLEYQQNGDLILADKGFTVAKECATCEAVLEIPTFTKGKNQLSKCEVDKSRELANVRIHVERVIGRLRKFEYLNSTIPIFQVDLLDSRIVTICGMVNMCKSVVD